MTTVNEYAKAYREKNKVRIKRVYDAWRIKNKEKLFLQRKEWRLKNPDKVKELTMKHKDNNKLCCKLYAKKNKEEIKRRKSEWWEKNKHRSRIIYKNTYIIRTYGIDLKRKNEMFSEQDGLCAICKKSLHGLSRDCCIDHDHKTGKIRKLLCNRCNAGLGMFRDDIAIINNAVLYLKQHL